MHRWRLLGLVTVIILAAVWVFSPDEETSTPPNILLIVLDDFGYNDLGANGNPNTPTPNLDSLAAQGTRYTRHYSDTTCSISRVALITGTSPAYHGIRPNRLGLSKGTPTIASMLSQVGYHTQHIGKWHIATAGLEQSPGQFGFNDWFGFLHSGELRGPPKGDITFRGPTYINPWLRENQSPLEQHEGHLTNIFTERALEFLDQHKDQAQPWFLNLWYFAPHHPIQPASNFKDKYPATKEGEFHALIDQLDYNVGQVMEALERNGQADDTLVIVLSDNGGTNSHTDNNFPFYGTKMEYHEGAQRTPLLMRWPGHIERGGVSEEIVSLLDIMPTIAQASSTTPPSGLIGRSLFDENRAAPPQLYWEYSNSIHHSYAVLSADGRWRLSHGFPNPILNDLVADPAGEENVFESHPEVAAKLVEDYFQWRKTARVVQYTYEELNNRGGAILRGADQQRTPGYSGFSFAIGITPSAEGQGEPQVILDQSERWKLQSTPDGRLNLEILGQKIEGPPLPAGQCSELVISSYFHVSPLGRSVSWSTIDIYLNGELVDSVRKEPIMFNAWGYANPTYVGFNSSGSEPFLGELGRPVILNEYVAPDALAGRISNGISGVPSTCAPTHSAQQRK